MSPVAAELSVTVFDADGSVTASVSLWASPVLAPPNTMASVPLICAALRATVELQVRAQHFEWSAYDPSVASGLFKAFLEEIRFLHVDTRLR